MAGEPRRLGFVGGAVDLGSDRALKPRHQHRLQSVCLLGCHLHALDEGDDARAGVIRGKRFVWHTVASQGQHLIGVDVEYVGQA